MSREHNSRPPGQGDSKSHPKPAEVSKSLLASAGDNKAQSSVTEVDPFP